MVVIVCGEYGYVDKDCCEILWRVGCVEYHKISKDEVEIYTPTN